MTNYEYYKEQIERITRLGLAFGIDKTTDEVACCNRINCTDCKFHGACSYKKIKWADEEYQEPTVDWNTIPIDTPTLVSDYGTVWYRRYFAGVGSDGTPTVYPNGATSWSVGETINSVTYNYIKLA